MRRIISYLLVATWMGVIFFASTEAGSPEHTSRILVPLLRWLKPDIAPETLKAVQTVVRKIAHLSEYGILSLLMWLGRKMDTGRFRQWSWREFWIIIAVCALYASSDEIHQYFVETRTSSPVDVCIDTLGASVSLCFLYLVGKVCRVWRVPAVSSN